MTVYKVVYLTDSYVPWWEYPEVITRREFATLSEARNFARDIEQTYVIFDANNEVVSEMGLA